ncbi:MAG TPA: hypothetical protein VMF07_00070 [Solirubrobacteraceae bacterium]|nr:hypothetical protein [Solirubrobacteraceae bacterium]
MQLRRSLLLTGVPLAAGLALASNALAAGSGPAVTVRVEGATKTLLPASTVSAPTTGSITKGHTPAGTCPADSAAGALNLATHGRWNGSYYKGLGIDVSTILGTTLSYSKGSYWGFYVNDRLAPKGICDTKIVKGESLLFAPVPAKGKAPKPIVVTGPKTVTAGTPFNLHAFVYTGKGNRTEALSSWHARWTSSMMHGAQPTVDQARTAPKGDLRFTVSGVSSGTLTFVVSSKGEIRSAATTVKVVK